MKIQSLKDQCNPLKMQKHKSAAVQMRFIYCRGTEALFFCIYGQSNCCDKTPEVFYRPVGHAFYM